HAARYALIGLLLTSVHHAYGAYIYATPWRYHAVLISGATALVILGSLARLRARPSNRSGTLALWVFVLTTLVVPVLAFGVFEGFYNHLVKNVLYFGGLSTTQMARLFPPPTYEMPNDAFFEITGILQVVPAALAAWQLYRVVRRRRLGSPLYATGK
ncbi:MAG TPA: hypothetical protein VEL76_05720, partial [Gemmataceae bacterium]|nr:hypothetical protein [Gemmataceae bacterium]